MDRGPTVAELGAHVVAWEVAEMERSTWPTWSTLPLAAGAGYVLARFLYFSWDTRYYDLRSVIPNQVLWQEYLFVLVAPIAIALVLKSLAHDHNDIMRTAAFAAIACGNVAARQILKLDLDVSGDWKAARAFRAFTWVFAAGMLLPCIAANAGPALRRAATTRPPARED